VSSLEEQTIGDADVHPRSVVICCSALLLDITSVCTLNNWRHLEVQCISAELHNYPDKIPAAVKSLIDLAREKSQQIFVAYADCGTGGLLDALLEQEQVERIPGAHCYEFYAGAKQFQQFHEAELGTFYLTDFLVRHFDRLVIRGLGLDKKPELMPLYFGHYRKLLYLAQTDNKKLRDAALLAAKKLGLNYEFYFSGRGDLAAALHKFNNKISTTML